MRPSVRALAWLLLPLGLVACGGDKKSPTGSSASDLAYLLQHNAQFNDGRTVRWPNLPIRVFTNDIVREDEVTEWTRATGGAVTFTFVGTDAGANITFRFGGGDDICGVTTVRYNSDGAILSAEVRVVRAVYRGPQCGQTIVHEVGHAIGFLDHTSDGGLMDPEGGDGEITAPVANMLRMLYSMAPGTPVTPGSALRRSGGVRSITIVDPVRR